MPRLIKTAQFYGLTGIPPALQIERAVIGNDLVRVNHMHIPAGAVFQRQPRYPDILTVTHMDKPPSHTPGSYRLKTGDSLSYSPFPAQ